MSRIQGKDYTDSATAYAGIDVCKAWLDGYFHPLGQRRRGANSREGLKQLRRELGGGDAVLAVIEATAKYHRLAHRTLHAWGLAVAVVNPLRSRLFAEASGTLAKTDRIDARMLALFGESLAPATTLPLPERVAFRYLRWKQVLRHGASQVSFLKRQLASLLTKLKAHIARLDEEIERRLAEDGALARRYQILKSIPGIGPVAASSLAVGLTELGLSSNKSIATLVGLAPVACDSGDKTGQRRIRGGRAHLRIPLYMAALAATRCNPELAPFYKRLRDNGKAAKLALTAVMRKLVVLANTLVREDRLWQPSRP